MKRARIAGLLAVMLTGARLEAQTDTNAPGATGTNGPPANVWSDFSVQINDGLGNPLSNVAVDVFLMAKDTNGDELKLPLGKAVSAENGVAAGRYMKGYIATNESFFVTLSKNGYATVTAPPQVNYVLKRVFTSNDVARIARLPLNDKNTQLPELLAGEMDSPKTTLADAVFAHEGDLYLAVRRLIPTRNQYGEASPMDAYVGRQAEELLAYIGNPSDIRLMLGDSHTPNGDPAVNRWADAMASALLAPTTDDEWRFLYSCASDDFGDHWVDLSGIRSLRLIASARSLQVLKNAREANPARTNQIDSAIAYIGSHPAPLPDKDLTIAAEKAARALDGSWLGNERPRYNEKRDKALVDLNVVSGGSHYLVYTATFHQDAGLWRLRGVRVTKDSLLPGAPPPKKNPAPKAPASAVETRRAANTN